MSLFRGNFLEVLNLVRDQNESVWKVTLQNAPGNSQMVAPCIQKDIARCFAQEVLKSNFEEISDDVFALLVDESNNISKNEQMAVDTSALSLKSAIDSLFYEYGLSLMKIRGQGYDGLVIVAIAKKHHDVGVFFYMVAVLMNVVCASCKHTNMIRESQKDKLEESIGHGEIERGSGLNKELSLTTAGDTR
ncbi:uncharacterized protein LOC111880403 [Lactuca sativa]|uniref:uncharacterized protein LOC111880403 n=1 Tax=Lactuca sativa TaxID=4236 RepID=UPI001C6906E1|nr:uncharacterized protein LOC111880403 [Lactuca sativa]